MAELKRCGRDVGHRTRQSCQDKKYNRKRGLRAGESTEEQFSGRNWSEKLAGAKERERKREKACLNSKKD